MRKQIAALAVLSHVFVASASWVQWPTQSKANVPRTPDGAVDMNAPAPRAANGKQTYQESGRICEDQGQKFEEFLSKQKDK